MAISRTKYIGLGTTILTIILLLGWFNFSYHFDVEYEGNKICLGDYEDPCEWNYNITLVTIPVYYIQNKNSTQFNFIPKVKEFYNCKKDRRYTASWRADRSLAPCGIGWKEFNWKTPLTSRYKYINKFYKGKKQEFKIVVFKFNPEDIIKFGGEITKSKFDPYFYGYNIIELCKWKTIQEDVFDYVTRERDKFETCIYYSNSTVCADEPINKSCYINTTEREYRCVVGKESYQNYEKTRTKDVVVCNKVIGYKVNNKIINCNKYGYGCDNKGTEFCLWNCLDGDCKTKLPFDYVKSRINDEIGGWSGIHFDVKNKNWHKFKMKLDSPKFKDIVIEDEQ